MRRRGRRAAAITAIDWARDDLGVTEAMIRCLGECIVDPQPVIRSAAIYKLSSPSDRWRPAFGAARSGLESEDSLELLVPLDFNFLVEYL